MAMFQCTKCGKKESSIVGSPSSRGCTSTSSGNHIWTKVASNFRKALTFLTT